MAIHLGVGLRRRSSSLPEDGVGVPLPAFRRASFYLALLQVGFGRRRVTAPGRALLPPDFTLACAHKDAGAPCGPSAVCFCAAIRRPAVIPRNAWVLPSTLPMEPGLSSQTARSSLRGHPAPGPARLPQYTPPP